MNNKPSAFLLLASGLLLNGPVYADHNSVWGEGWANMPNDIHNTRIDTMDSDSSEFTDFVRYGAGADSVNRFATDETRSATASQRPTATEAVSQRVDRTSTQPRRIADVSRSTRAASMRPVTSRGRH